MESATESFAHIVAAVLGHIAVGNTYRSHIETPFHCDDPVPISLDEYMHRMSTFMGCSQECFVMGCVLITRLEAIYAHRSVITTLSVHRLILTAVVIAAKMHEDQCFLNQHYADVGGIPLEELNQLELYMVKQLGWNLHVSRSEFRGCQTVLDSIYTSLTTMPQVPQVVYVEAQDSLVSCADPALLECGVIVFEDMCVGPCVMIL